MGAIISGLAGWLLQFLGTAFIGVMAYMLSDVILGFVGDLVGVISNSVSSVTGLPNVAAAWAELPIEMLQMAKRLNVDEAMSIIVAAVSVRWAGTALQFVRGLRRGVTP